MRFGINFFFFEKGTKSQTSFKVDDVLQFKENSFINEMLEFENFWCGIALRTELEDLNQVT